MEKPIRDYYLTVRLNTEERDMIEARMAQYGATNMSAFVRKMAIDGYIINLDLPELRSISTLLHRAGNNINQIAKRANATHRVYDTDIQEITENQKKLLSLMGKLLKSLSRLQ